MIGVDLFDLNRQTYFSNQTLINRFFYPSEQALIKHSNHPTKLACKLFCCKEVTYKILHNLFPSFSLNKFLIEVSYINFVFKVKFHYENYAPNDERYLALSKLNFCNFHFSDSDENNYLMMVGIYQPN
ncbi:4'-phosphopantetheinyl transferase superfamily protein [bacterium]|nr:4'-phosphopantetheinyl transferase superfamily protein [bacterium]